MFTITCFSWQFHGLVGIHEQYFVHFKYFMKSGCGYLFLWLAFPSLHCCCSTTFLLIISQFSHFTLHLDIVLVYSSQNRSWQRFVYTRFIWVLSPGNCSEETIWEGKYNPYSVFLSSLLLEATWAMSSGNFKGECEMCITKGRGTWTICPPTS